GAKGNGGSSSRSTVRLASRRTRESRSPAVRSQDVAGDEETALHELVGSLERTVLVLDDAVPRVAGPVQLGEDRAPFGLPKARDAGDLPAHTHREDPPLVQPVAIDHQVLRLEVQDVRPELL